MLFAIFDNYAQFFTGSNLSLSIKLYRPKSRPDASMSREICKSHLKLI